MNMAPDAEDGIRGRFVHARGSRAGRSGEEGGAVGGEGDEGGGEAGAPGVAAFGEAEGDGAALGAAAGLVFENVGLVEPELATAGALGAEGDLGLLGKVKETVDEDAAPARGKFGEDGGDARGGDLVDGHEGARGGGRGGGRRRGFWRGRRPRRRWRRRRRP